MDRRRFLRVAALGASALAGCGGRDAPGTGTLTPAPVPDASASATRTAAGRIRFSTTPCPRLDGPTTCAHAQPTDAPLRLRTPQVVLPRDGTFRAVLHNRSGAPVSLAPRRWGVWRRSRDAWTPTAGGDGGDARELAPGGAHEWALALGGDAPSPAADRTVASLSLPPDRYALGVPAADRTFAALFDVV